MLSFVVAEAYKGGLLEHVYAIYIYTCIDIGKGVGKGLAWSALSHVWLILDSLDLLDQDVKSAQSEVKVANVVPSPSPLVALAHLARRRLCWARSPQCPECPMQRTDGWT